MIVGGAAYLPVENLHRKVDQRWHGVSNCQPSTLCDSHFKSKTLSRLYCDHLMTSSHSGKQFPAASRPAARFTLTIFNGSDHCCLSGQSWCHLQTGNFLVGGGGWRESRSTCRFILNLLKAWSVHRLAPTVRVIKHGAEQTFWCQSDLLIHHNVLRGHWQVCGSWTVVKTLGWVYGKIQKSHSFVLISPHFLFKII